MPWLLAGLMLLLVAPRAGCQGVPGLDLSGGLVADGMGVVSGGVERSWAGLYNVDLQAELDGESVGWAGGRVFLYVLGNGGRDPSELVGDFQAVSNIAAPDTWKLFEAWVEQDVADGAASIRAGLYDLNAEFDVLESAATLVNSSFGIGPDFSQSCLTGPSIFPTTSLALRLEADAGGSFRIRAAVLDGVAGDPSDPYGTEIVLDRADGVLLTGEAEWASSRGRAAAGAWGYTRAFETNRAHVGVPGAGDEEGVSFGGYALAEGLLRGEEDPDQGLRGFLRAGFASGRVNRIGSYLGAGASYTGLLPGRERDELAVGLAAARNSDEFLAARSAVDRPADRWELTLEATYALRVDEWLVLQPDLQVVLNPGTEPAVGDAVVLGLRVRLQG